MCIKGGDVGKNQRKERERKGIRQRKIKITKGREMCQMLREGEGKEKIERKARKSVQLISKEQRRQKERCE